MWCLDHCCYQIVRHDRGGLMSTVIHYQDAGVLRILLDLADNPRDVKITTEFEGPAVVVPDELYERYVMYQSLDSSSPKEPKKKEKKS
jgi:hypothetical protein